MIPTITRAQVISWSPCCHRPGERYDDARLDALQDHRQGRRRGCAARMLKPIAHGGVKL